MSETHNFTWFLLFSHALTLLTTQTQICFVYMKNKHKIRIDLSAVQLVMCRVPENPKTRPEPRLFYWPEPDPNPKKKSKTRPEPTRKNCKPARNPTGFISSKVRAKLPIFWWIFGVFFRKIYHHISSILFCPYFLLFFTNKFFSNNQKFFFLQFLP